jgi:sortase A
LFTFQWLAVTAVLSRWLVQRWGRWQTWIVAAPVLLVLGATTADCAMALLPNLI